MSTQEETATSTGVLPAMLSASRLQFASHQMRRFVIDRKSDITGISGTGIIL